MDPVKTESHLITLLRVLSIETVGEGTGINMGLERSE